MEPMDTVRIFDTTLRDGEQSPGATLTLPEKLEIARLLESMGVDIIEAGFPISSNGDFESVQAIAAEIGNSVVCGLARCTPEDIDRAGEAVKSAAKKRIHVFCATSKIHREHKLKKGKEEIIRISVESIKQARQYTDDVEFSPEDASRTELDFLEEIVHAAVEAGATTINLPDTVGYATPKGVRRNLFASAGEAADSASRRTSFSRAIATTIWGWPSPIRWRRSKTAPGRSNARSTASASARATPRWKKSSWPAYAAAIITRSTRASTRPRFIRPAGWSAP